MLALRCPARARRAADKLCNIIKVEESDTVLHTGGSTEELNSVLSASMLAGSFCTKARLFATESTQSKPAVLKMLCIANVV